MKLTNDQLQCIAQASLILMDIRTRLRESYSDDVDLETMACAGAGLLGGIINHLAKKKSDDTVSEFKTPYANVSTNRVADSTEGQSKARSFGDEGP